MFSGQENTETPVVNKIVYNPVAFKRIISIFPLTQCSLGFAHRLPEMKSIAPPT
jgi:hypothetical protein